MNTKKNNWFKALKEGLTDNYNESRTEEEHPKSVFTSVDFRDGSAIEVTLYRDNHIEVDYYHADEDVDRDCQNITQYMEDNLPSWDELEKEWKESLPEDEWTAHGFRNEADYWHYRLG
jgi:dTDP-D-glucose 4,6-dehydratase